MTDKAENEFSRLVEAFGDAVEPVLSTAEIQCGVAALLRAMLDRSEQEYNSAVAPELKLRAAGCCDQLDRILAQAPAYVREAAE